MHHLLRIVNTRRDGREALVRLLNWGYEGGGMSHGKVRIMLWMKNK
jgi:hypothetical protein